MILTYRYDLKPSRAQYAELDRLLELQRLLYNGALQERVEAWRSAHVDHEVGSAKVADCDPC